MDKLFAELVQLSLDNVTVGYDGIKIVHNVSLTLGNGQIGCLLGPSGCGKSTLLRAIAGFEPVMGGEITMEKIANIYRSARKSQNWHGVPRLSPVSSFNYF
jgi:ABC-type Fe3+/spermidine/putrescine transport system ATPase subunit